MVILSVVVSIIFIASPILLLIVGLSFKEERASVLGNLTLLLSILMIPAIVFLSIWNQAPAPATSHSLISLQDGQSVHGSFFLGSGTVDGKMVYTWYEKDKNNQYTLHMHDANDALIVYTSDKPHIDTYNNYKAYKHWYLPSFAGPQKIKIYVPKGTIKSNYTLDAK